MHIAAITLALAALPANAAAAQMLSDLFGERPALTEKKLKKALEKAAEHPLGSEKNPVRADMPGGQRAYLARLRCADGKAPAFFREGSMGIGTFGNIIDGYRVSCEGSAPSSSLIIMDMYFAGHVEDAAVPGFTIVGHDGQPAPSAVTSAPTS
jgi:hypothetical protein